MMMKFIYLLLFVLLSMGFYLLIERKFMGLVHFRFGPNKVLFMGIFQFLLDMIKLLFKEYIYIYTFKLIYLFFLILMLILSLVIWFIIFFNYINFFNYYFFLFLMFIMLLKLLFLVYFLLSLKSMYVQISFIRVIVQFISYDILIVLIVILIIFIIKSFHLIVMFMHMKYTMFFLFNFYFLILWSLSILMEILRLPFDFYESESELISGFNLELGSFKFMVLFMVEYLDMIYFSNMTVYVYFYCNLVYFFNVFYLIFLLWVRLMIIRYRYDLMVVLMWKKLFLIIFFFFLFYSNLVFFF